MKGDIGPDRVIPTDDLTTWDRNGAVRIRSEKSGMGAMPPVSIPTFVKQNCMDGGSRAAIKVKRNGKWITWTFTEYHAFIRCAARAFIACGLEPKKSVAISGFNSPEWFLSSFGAIFAGGFSVGLYPTNSPEMNKFIMADAETNVLVVEDEAALNKMWKVIQEVDSIKKVVQYSGTPSKPGVLSWEEFMNLGNRQNEDILEQRLRDMAINQCAVLIYTSGTTGNPKGVMLSHDNIVWTTEVALKTCGFENYSERFVSYLPLSHIAACLIDMYAPIGCKATLYFADKSAMKGTLVQTLQEARPTRFFGVPRVWEKIMEGMLDKGKAIKGLKKKISVACKEAGLQHHLQGKDTFMWNVGQKAIYPKVKQALGLDCARGFYSAAAPIGIDTLKYFLSLDMVIVELYGMSETTGPHTLSNLSNRRLGSVGKVLEGAKHRLSEPNEDGEGEYCMWGRNVMMGYLGREDKTTEDIDPEGWMHSGDMSTIDKDGFVYITGRIKELLITAGGENVAPVPIEENIKKEVPIVSNAVLIGDKKKFLTVFLTFKTVIDTKTEMPTNELTASAIDWCRSLGRNHTTVESVLRGPDPVVMAAIQAGIDRANKNAVSNAARVQKWTILPVDVSIPGGELGPTLKLKRFAFNKKYDGAIERLYA